MVTDYFNESFPDARVFGKYLHEQRDGLRHFAFAAFVDKIGIAADTEDRCDLVLGPAERVDVIGKFSGGHRAPLDRCHRPRA